MAFVHTHTRARARFSYSHARSVNVINTIMYVCAGRRPSALDDVGRLELIRQRIACAALSAGWCDDNCRSECCACSNMSSRTSAHTRWHARTCCVAAKYYVSAHISVKLNGFCVPGVRAFGRAWPYAGRSVCSDITIRAFFATDDQPLARNGARLSARCAVRCACVCV